MITMDYNFITSMVSILAVIFTMVIFIVETRHGNLALKTDLLFKIQDKFDSNDFRKVREIAARKIISRERPNYELSDILDMFSTIGFLYERKALDQDLAYKNFSYWMIRYWLCSTEYVENERKIDPLGWKTLEKITEELIKREMLDGYPPYSVDLLSGFLCEEARFSKEELMYRENNTDNKESSGSVDLESQVVQGFSIADN